MARACSNDETSKRQKIKIIIYIRQGNYENNGKRRNIMKIVEKEMRWLGHVQMMGHEK